MADGTRMQQRRATKSVWDTSNYVLAAGEIGVEIDTNIIKVGNGTTPWTNLPAAFGSTYLPVLGKAADSDRLDGISSEGFVQIGDTSALPTASKVALRNSSGRLKAATATEDDDLTTLLQQTTALTVSKRELLIRNISIAGVLTAADLFGFVTLTNASRQATLGFVLPKDTTLTVPVGTWVDVCAAGTGPIRVTAEAGATLNGDGRVYGAGGVVRFLKQAANTWRVMSRVDPADAYASCSAYADANVMGWGAGWKHIPCNAEHYDTHGGHVTGAITGEDTDTTVAKQSNRYTVQPCQEGWYEFAAQLNATIGTNSTVHCRWLANGGVFQGSAGLTSTTANSGTVQTGTKQLYLNEGMYIGFQGYCNNANWNTQAGESTAGGATTFMTVQRIG